MKTKTTKELLSRDGVTTVNTKGVEIFTLKIQKTYYMCKLPVWRKTRLINGTLAKLAGEIIGK